MNNIISLRAHEVLEHLEKINQKETVSIKIDTLSILEEFLFFLNEKVYLNKKIKFFDHPDFKSRLIKKIRTLTSIKFKLLENEILFENKKRDFKIYKENKEKFYIKWLKIQFYSKIFLFDNGLDQLKDTFLILEKINKDDVIFRLAFVYQEEFKKLYEYEKIKKINIIPTDKICRYDKKEIIELYNSSIIKRYNLITIEQFLDRLEKTNFMDYLTT